MNAIEFVKKFGICEAKSVLLKSEYHNEVDVYLPDTKEFTYIAVSPTNTCPYVGLKDLKKIVEAWELVFEHGSIERAKKYADSTYTAPEIKDVLKQAINLVEQCQ